MVNIQKVIDIALAEVGYLEKKSNSNLDSKTSNAGSGNYTKYGRDLDAIGFYNGRKNGVAWCDQFFDWVQVQAFGKDVALDITFQPKVAASNCGAGCAYSRNYYKNNGRLYDKPEPGDQIFFWNSEKSRVSHTGLVYKVDASNVYTVEGNTSGASGVVANGGGVKQKKYKLNYNRIAGYGRPAYEKILGNAEDASTEAIPENKIENSLDEVVVIGKTVNVRKGPGKEYDSMHIAKKGDVFKVADMSNFVPIIYGKYVYWISKNYIKKVGN